MTWKKGKVKFDDGSTYPAELLVKPNGQVWNVRIFKDNGVIEEIDAQVFSSKLGKDPESVYPYTFELED